MNPVHSTDGEILGAIDADTGGTTSTLGIHAVQDEGEVVVDFVWSGGDSEHALLFERGKEEAVSICAQPLGQALRADATAALLPLGDGCRSVR